MNVLSFCVYRKLESVLLPRCLCYLTSRYFSSSHYETLGVEKKATQEEIRAAFLTLSKKHHPDVNKSSQASNERFSKITEAYLVLSKPYDRLEYDQKLEAAIDLSQRLEYREYYNRQYNRQFTYRNNSYSFYYDSEEKERHEKTKQEKNKMGNFYESSHQSLYHWMFTRIGPCLLVLFLLTMPSRLNAKKTAIEDRKRYLDKRQEIFKSLSIRPDKKKPVCTSGGIADLYK